MKKRPRDPAQLAKFIVDVATGEVEDREPAPRKPPASAAEIGKKGGIARAKKLSKKQRSKIASVAAKQRWKEDA